MSHLNFPSVGFNFESQEICPVIVDGEPWFITENAGNVLKLTNPSVSLKASDKNEGPDFKSGRQHDSATRHNLPA